MSAVTNWGMLMRRLDWHRAPEGSLRHRLADLRRGRLSWPKLVMNLTGRAWCGSYDVPKGRTLYYYPDPTRRGRFVTTYNHADVRANPREEWHNFDIQNDGFELHLGYVNSSFFYLTRDEQTLLLRWWFLEHKLRGEWLGLRRWAYYKALHAHVTSFTRRNR